MNEAKDLIEKIIQDNRQTKVKLILSCLVLKMILMNARRHIFTLTYPPISMDPIIVITQIIREKILQTLDKINK